MDIPEKTDRHKLLEKIQIILFFSSLLIYSLALAKKDLLLRNILTVLILLISVITIFVVHRANNPDTRWLRLFIPLALVIVFILDILIPENDILFIIFIILSLAFIFSSVTLLYKNHKMMGEYRQERKEKGVQSGKD